jgi:hypothetical protein
MIGSFGTKAFDFKNGKILYNDEADKIFKLFRQLQTEGTQTRYENANVPKNIAFDLTPTHINSLKTTNNKKLGRNDKVNVVYQDGKRVNDIKYKKVISDIESGKCRITV